MENGHTDSGGLLANCGEGGGFSFVFGFVVCYIYSVALFRNESRDQTYLLCWQSNLLW